MPECPHEQFRATVAVNRLKDSGRFSADLRIRCTQCDVPFVFLGLPMGLDLNGAAVSVDGTEARLAIEPPNYTGAEPGGLSGYTVRLADPLTN